MIIVSNLGPDLTYGSSSAMNDRMIPIEFSPRLGAANPKLNKQLEENESGIVNVLMNMDPEIFPNLTRAGLFNKEITYETNFLVPFILNKLYFEVDSVISITALLAGYQNWASSNNIKKSDYTFDLGIDLASVALTLFNRRLIRIRKTIQGKRVQVLTGVRWREPTDPSQDTEQNSYVMEHDPWAFLRNKGDHPIYEIDNFRIDLEKTNQTILNNGQIVAILGLLRLLKSGGPKPLPTTDEIQNQYLNKRIAEVTKVVVKGSVKTSTKSLLVFAESKTEQFPIPQKFSDKELGVTKITNHEEQHKYLDQPLPTHSKKYFIDKFDLVHKSFCDLMGYPLMELKFKENFKYHPHVLFKETETVRKRIYYLSQLGEISTKLEHEFGGRHIIWCESLRAAQLKFPVPKNKTASKQNLFQKKKNFTGHLFPTYYYFDSEGSPRLKSYPGHTIRDGHKGFRNEVFKRFTQYCGLYLYNTDLSSCHVRVIMMFLDEINAPLLYKSFHAKDLYLEIAMDLKRSCDALHVFSDKLLRKIIKIKCLAMLNGGGLLTENHINHLVDDLYPIDSNEYNKIIEILLSSLSDLPIVIEFRSHGQFIAEKSKVYILSNSTAITSTDSQHILSSPVMCSVESLTMTF